MSNEQDLIDEGYSALRVGDSAAARRRAFDSALVANRSGAGLEGSARAAYLDHEYGESVELWGSAYEAYRGEGDGVGAIRVARTLAYMYLSVFGDRAVMQGWFARAVSLLAEEGPCPETGWVSLNQGMFESDPELKEQRFRQALAHARESGDSSLEFATLAYLGGARSQRPRRRGHAPARRGAGRRGGTRRRRLPRRRRDLLSTLLRVRIRPRCRPGRSMDPGWRGDRRPSKPAGGGCVLPDPLRRVADRGRAVGRSRHGPPRRRTDLGSRSQLAASRGAGAPGRAAGSPGSLRRGRATAGGPRRGHRSDTAARRSPTSSEAEPDRAVAVLERALDGIDPTSGAAGPLWAWLVDAHIASGDHGTPRPRSTSWSAAPTGNPAPTCGLWRRWPGAGSA